MFSGAESILGAPSALHHAAPGKKKIPNSLLSSVSVCGCDTSEGFFSVNRQTQYARVVVTHKVPLIREDLHS